MNVYLVSLIHTPALFASMAVAITTTYIPLYSKIRVDKGPKRGGLVNQQGHQYSAS